MSKIQLSKMKFQDQIRLCYQITTFGGVKVRNSERKSGRESEREKGPDVTVVGRGTQT